MRRDSSKEAPERPSSGAQRVHQLDGLRGVAMLFVFLGHFVPLWANLARQGGSADFFIRLVDADATLGSSFFMLISGMFGYGSMMRGRRSFSDFIRGRLWRIYPLYLIMVLVYVIGSLVIPKLSKLPSHPLEAAFFLLETLLLLPGLIPTRPLMDVAWTLSFIVLFYFVEGCVAWIFKRQKTPRFIRFVLLLGAGILWAVAGSFTQWWEPRTTMLWIGMALWEATDAMRENRARAEKLVPLATCLAGSGIFLRTVLMMTKPDTGVVPLLLVRAGITAISLFWFVWVAFFGPEWWKRVLAGSQLRQLGAVSYSFYLTHGLAVKVFRYGVLPLVGPSNAGNEAVFWLSQAVGLVLAVVTSRLVFRYVEEPLAELSFRFRGKPAFGGAVFAR